MKNAKRILTALILSVCICSTPTQAVMSPQASILYQEACSAEHQQDLKQAIAKLEKAIEISGGDTMLYTKLAGIYAETDDYDKALDTYQKVIKINPDDAFIYISIGNIYENQGKYKDALNAYSKALDIFPEYKYNYFNLGNVQYQLKNYNEAIKDYSAFLETYSSHNDARENLAASYLAIKDYKNAKMQYEVLYNKNPENFKFNYQYGISLLNTENPEKAVDFLEKAIEIDAENNSAHLGLAQAYQDLGKNEMSYEQYQIVLKNVPNLNTVRLDYANLLADMDKNTEAIEQYNMYIKAFENDVKGYISLADVYKKVKNYDKAIENYSIALAKDEKNIELKKNLANCYHNKKDYEDALKYYNEILEETPNDFNTLFNKALALHALNKYDDAIALYKELLAIKQEKSIKNNLNSALVARGHELVSEGKAEEAISDFKEALKGGYTDGYVYYGMAKAYRLNGNNTKAAENYEKAIEVDRDKALYSTEYSDFISSMYKPQINVQTIGASEELPTITLSMDNIEEEKPQQPAPAPITENKDEQKPEAKPNTTTQKIIDTKLSDVAIKKNENFISEGDKNFKSSNFDLAIKNYQNALQLIPNDAETLLKLGLVYKFKGDNAREISYYQKAIIVNPDYTDGWFNLGIAYDSDNNFVEAQKSFEKVIELNPNYNSGYAYYGLALVLEHQGKKSEAIKNYKTFVKTSNDKEAISDAQKHIKQLQQ